MEDFINTLLPTEAGNVCGAAYGARDEARTNRRDGYRHRDLGCGSLSVGAEVGRG
jgi:transposase-like protein